MRVAFLLSLLAGCSLVNDPGDHMGGASPTPDATIDATDTPDADASTPDADAAPAPIPAAEFCSELVELYCNARKRCCAGAEDENIDTCRNERAGPCANFIGGYATDSRNNYDPQRAAEVIAEGAALAETCDEDIVKWFATRDGIARVLRGTIPEAQGCSALNGTYLACVRPLACRGGAAVLGTCRPLAEEGEPCDGDLECVEPLQCDVGACRARRANGSMCEGIYDCESLTCTEMICAPGTDTYCIDPFIRRD